ncbi:MAG: T9SS type A sorting domain-containing protein, partial [Salinibacter sp.]
DLNNNISAGGDIDRCDAVTIDENDFVYFSFRSSSDNVNHIYRTDVGDASTFSTEEINGINGLETDGSTLYLAGVTEFGATGNGIFEMNSDLSGNTTVVATSPDVDLRDATIEAASDGTLYGWSTGSGSLENVIVSLDPSDPSPDFSAFVDPYGSGSPLNQTGDAISDLEIISFEGSEYIVVYNGSFDGPNAEEWGTIQLSDQSIDLLFTRDDLVDNTSADEYTGGFTEPMITNADGEVFVTSRDAFGASDYIAQVSDAPPLPVELAGFEAVRSGSGVELSWKTASETNNAGFRVQHQADEEDAWSELDFVESKASDGTTAEAQTYRFDVSEDLEPGTHRFRLEQADLDGSTTLSDVVSVEVGMDEVLSLSAPAPNPASGQTTLSFGVKRSVETTVGVYNVLGQRVKTLYEGTPSAEQTRDVSFDAGSLPSGMYFVRMQADGQTETQRLTVVQ